MPRTIKLIILIIWGILLWPLSAYCIALFANFLNIAYFALFQPQTYQAFISCEDNCGGLVIAWFFASLIPALVVVAFYFRAVMKWYQKTPAQ
jgi:hypothetical protein